MTAYVVYTNTTVASPAPAYALVGADSLFIAPNAALVHTGTGPAVTGTGTNDVAIGGGLVSTQNTAFSFTGANGNTFLTILRTGYVYAYSSAIASNASAFSLTNNGEIVGATGVQISGPNGALTATNSNIVNNGLITASSGGMAVDVNSSGSTSFTNAGLVSGTARFSTFEGFSYISRAAGADVVTNAGKFVGSIYLGGGADIFDGANGQVAGSVYGGQGADIITGGLFADVFYGDDTATTAQNVTTGGADTLSGGGGDDILNGGYGADILYGNQDNDALYGNQDNDWMHGGQGDDGLFGGQGNDTLNGGKGDDTLSGNLGDDLFVFSSAFGHDIVTDFRAAGANDIIQFSPDTFGDFTAVQAGATAVTNGTLLTDAAGDTVLLVGIAPGALTTAMFTFS